MPDSDDAPGADPTDAPVATRPAASGPATPSSPTPSPMLRGRLPWVLGAIAVGIIAAVVIVSVASGDDDESADPGSTGDTVDIATDGGEGATASEDTPSDQGATTIPEVDIEGPFDVVLEPGAGGVLHVDVADPATPALDGAAQHCVLVTLDGPASVEAYGCTDGVAPGELVLSEPGAPLVGCAAVATRSDPSVPESVSSTSQFDISPAAELPPGDYDVEATVITGVGDGCPPADAGTERETVARTRISVS